ncbi:MAG: CHASE2 domain-containing protein, partial [Alphaproteobacteria bacterium]|nr:CHASE2 domain-containing protein [Alphaproteobacteria bacterium]
RPEYRTLVIEIDEDSIRRVGQWPWPRDQLSRLVEMAAAARVIGIDLLLPEADRLAGHDHETDKTLAAALRQAPVVLAAAAEPSGEAPPHPMPAATPVFEAGKDPRLGLPHYRSVSWPQAALADAARGTGLVTVPPEGDGVIRRMPTVGWVGSVLLPAFGVEVVRVATHADRISLRTGPTGGRVLEIGNKSFPTDTAGDVWLRYAVDGTIPSVPADRVLQGNIDREVFRDRVVLIGTSAPGLGDAFETPLRHLESGVSIQAQLVESLLAGDFLRCPNLAPALERLLAAVLAIGSLLLFGRIGDKAYALLCGSAVILLGAGSFGSFVAAGVFLDATLPTTALLGTNLVLLAERTHREVRTRRSKETALANALREAELRAEAERARESLAIALDAARMGIWDADLIDGTARRSARHDEILGYTAPSFEWSRETLLARVVAEDRDAAARSLDTAMETGALHLQCRIRGPDRALRSIAVDGRVYHNEDGTPIRIAGVVADVADRRRIEESLQQTQRLQAVGAIAGGVAHNFNNLLAIILGNLDLASRPRSETERVRPYLVAATAAAERGAKLTWQLLSFARQQPLRPERISPSEHLRNFSMLVSQALPANIAVETDIPQDLWAVEVDPGELQLALFNLAFNARDAMPGGGSLRISATNREVQENRHGGIGRGVMIEIADNGPGIPSDILPRVFEPFMTTKEIGAGSGLGLSQVHGFVHQSGGAVEIDSEPGRGTIVRIDLPAATRARSTAPDAPSLKRSDRITGAVLVVEDEPALANLAAELLAQWHREIKVVPQASTALTLLREGEKVDLVFADIIMPEGMDGLQLAEAMKLEFPDIPILLTSGDSNIAADAAAKGFHVIRKPYRMEELGMSLQRLLVLHSA